MLPHIPEVAMRYRPVSTLLLFAALIVNGAIVTAIFSANNHEAVARIDVVPGPDNTAVIVFAGGSNNHGWVALTGISSYVP
jgi:hypothetical protein